MSATHQPPHLVKPKLTYLTDEEWKAYWSAVERGFNEEIPESDEATRLDKGISDITRFFGFKAADRWVSTCGAFTRKLVVPGGTKVDAGAVTVVTVAGPYRRRGLLSQMMKHQLEDIHARGEAIATLWASESLIYGRFGYGIAQPRARLSGPTQLPFLPTIDLGAGSVDEVSREVYQEAASAINTKVLSQRPGAHQRSKAIWDWMLFDPEHGRDGLSAARCLLHYDESGTPNGYARYRIKDNWIASGPDAEIQISEIDAATPAAYAKLWRYLLDLDLVRKFLLRNAPADAGLRYLVADQRAVKTEISDGTFIRIVDLPAALSARQYATDIDAVIEIEDSLLLHNNGRWHLKSGPDGVTCKPARRKADVTMGILELGTIYLAGPTLADLHRAGRVTEHKKGSVHKISAAFRWDRAPFCPDFY